VKRLFVLLGLLILMGSVSATTYTFSTDFNYTNQWYDIPPKDSVGIANIQGNLDSVGNIVGGKQNFTGHFTVYQCSGNNSIWYSFYNNWTLGYNISYNTAAGTTVQARRIQQASSTYNMTISDDNKSLTVDFYVISITQNASTTVGAVRFYGLPLEGFQFGGAGSYYVMSNMSLDYGCGGSTTTTTTSTTVTTTTLNTHLECGFDNSTIYIDDDFTVYSNITDDNILDMGAWWYTLSNDTTSYRSNNFYGSLNGFHSDTHGANELHVGTWMMIECNLSNDTWTTGMGGYSNPTLSILDTTTTTTTITLPSCPELCVSSGFNNESTNCTALWGGCGAIYYFTGSHTSDCPVNYCCCLMNQTTTSTTLPSNNLNTLLVSVHKAVLFRNESFVLYALFWDRGGVILEDADCYYSADGAVVNLSQAIDHSMRFEPSNWVNVYPLSINSNAAAGSSRIYVTCNLSGYITTQNSTLITVNAGAGGLSWVQKLVSDVQRSSHSAIVSFKDSGGSSVYGICNLTVDDSWLNNCATGIDGSCSLSYYYETIGSHSYTVSCAGSGVSTQFLTDSFTVSQPSGLTTSTTLQRIVPGHCSNGYQDGGETDIDCGGSCGGCNLGGSCVLDSDCSRGVCEPRNRICQVPNCPDGYARTHNFFIDCGAPSCPPCECGSATSLTGCDTSGFEHCNATTGKCVADYCLVNMQCPALLIDGSVRQRICIENQCRFTSSTPYLNSSTANRVYPLSGIIFKDAGDFFYLAVCEDSTNGFRVVTNDSTHTQYKSDSSMYSPSLNASLEWAYFGVNGRDKSALIPELCLWNGNDFRYALVELHSEKDGAAVSSDYINVLVEKTSFKASCVLGSGIKKVVCNLSRSGRCFARGNVNSLFVNMSAADAVYFDFDFSVLNSSSALWFCNSSHGEPRSGSVSSSGWGQTGDFLGKLWVIFFGGVVWKPWYILLIGYGLVIFIPLLIILYRDRRTKK